MRPFDRLAPDPVPALAEPQGRRRIAAVGDELGPFLVADLAVGDGVGREQGAVARALAVEGEAVIARADLDHTLAAGVEAQRLDGEAGDGRELAIGRLERVLGEGRE